MWSLVAKDTREGDVYTRLLEKLEQQRTALGGRVYDVLGQVFDGNSLRDLMMEAIMKGDSPEAQAALFEVVDAHVGDGIAEVLAEDQLVPTMLTSSEIDDVRREMDRAEAARLQPHHVESFFTAAFADLGGALGHANSTATKSSPYPRRSRSMDRIAGRGVPVMDKYSRVAFDRPYVRVEGHAADATLLHPGHPLMKALLSVIGDRYGDTLRHGTILIDKYDPSITPYVVCLLEHDITDGRTDRTGHPQIVSRRVQYVRVDPDGNITPIAQTPIPNLDVPSDEELATARRVLAEHWASAADLDHRVVGYASATIARNHLSDISTRTHERIDKTTRLVRARLQHEIDYWDRRAYEIRENERAGKSSRLPAGQAQARAEELSRRLDRRLKELALERSVAATPPRVTGAVLVIPQGWFNAQVDPEGAAAHARETVRIETIAVNAVLDIERGSGTQPHRHAPQQPRIRHRIRHPQRHRLHRGERARRRWQHVRTHPPRSRHRPEQEGSRRPCPGPRQ